MDIHDQTHPPDGPTVTTPPVTTPTATTPTATTPTATIPPVTAPTVTAPRLIEGKAPPPDNRRWLLILSYREHVTRLVRGRLWNAHDVDDCVQEVLLRAVLFQRLDEERIGAFLTTTALRLCVDYYRDWDRQRRLRQRLVHIEHAPEPEELVADLDLGRWMLAHVRHLHGREQQVMLARADGMTNRQIAQRYGLSAKAVESAFTRGRARLRSLFENSMTASSADSAVGVPAPARTYEPIHPYETV